MIERVHLQIFLDLKRSLLFGSLSPNESYGTSRMIRVVWYKSHHTTNGDRWLDQSLILGLKINPTWSLRLHTVMRVLLKMRHSGYLSKYYQKTSAISCFSAQLWSDWHVLIWPPRLPQRLPPEKASRRPRTASKSKFIQKFHNENFNDEMFSLNVFVRFEIPGLCPAHLKLNICLLFTEHIASPKSSGILASFTSSTFRAIQTKRTSHIPLKPSESILPHAAVPVRRMRKCMIAPIRRTSIRKSTGP